MEKGKLLARSYKPVSGQQTERKRNWIQVLERKARARAEKAKAGS
jgi:hypothetical protein